MSCTTNDAAFSHASEELDSRSNKQLTCVNGGLVYVPYSRGFNDIPNHKLLNSFVLGHAARAVGASHGLDVAAAVLGASSITAFASLKT